VVVVVTVPGWIVEVVVVVTVSGWNVEVVVVVTVSALGSVQRIRPSWPGSPSLGTSPLRAQRHESLFIVVVKSKKAQPGVVKHACKHISFEALLEVQPAMRVLKSRLIWPGVHSGTGDGSTLMPRSS
jgi:hypothetical protein